MSSATYPGMTDLAGKLAAIAAGGGDLLAVYDRQWRLIEDADTAAKEAGSLAGRYCQFPVADGRALYEICLADRGKAYLRHLRIGDAYRALTLEGLATSYRDPFDASGILFAVDLAFVNANIRQRDALDQLFASREATA